MTEQILDVGCGEKKVAGAIGIDVVALPTVDIVHDLTIFPWPLDDSSFDHIVCNHIIEHVDDILSFMQEIHRVGKPDAVVDIVTPHYTNRFSYTDPTHRHHLALRSLDYFIEAPTVFRRNFFHRVFETAYPIGDFSFYSTVRFRKITAHFSMARPFRITGLQWLFNHLGDFYELYLAFIFPARDLYFSLQVIK